MGGRTLGSKPPASPPPLPRPNGGSQPWPCTCVHGPKKSTRQRACHQPVQDNANCGTPQNLHCLDQPRHLSLHNNRHVNDSVQHRSCNCGISTVSSQNAPRACRTCTTNIDRIANVLQQENLRGLLNSETMGTCLCAPTGMTKTCVAQQRANQLLVKELQPWNLDGLLNSQSHGDQTLRRDRDVDDLDDELHLRHLHCDASLEQGMKTLSYSCTCGMAT